VTRESKLFVMSAGVAATSVGLLVVREADWPTPRSGASSPSA
jgi:hypothetical protein